MNRVHLRPRLRPWETPRFRTAPRGSLGAAASGPERGWSEWHEEWLHTRSVGVSAGAGARVFDRERPSHVWMRRTVRGVGTHRSLAVGRPVPHRLERPTRQSPTPQGSARCHLPPKSPQPAPSCYVALLSLDRTEESQVSEVKRVVVSGDSPLRAGSTEKLRGLSQRTSLTVAEHHRDRGLPRVRCCNCSFRASDLTATAMQSVLVQAHNP